MELEESVRPVSAVEASTDALNAESHKEDVTDIPPKSSRITNCDIFFLILSIIAHCSDVCVDVNIVVQYFLNNKISMFAWTITLILVPSFINTVISFQMYHQDRQV